MPLSQYVFKVHSRCDLACDHCYMYELADQTWRDRPVVMSLPTVRAAAARIAEHARVHRLAQVRIVLHGGEPLLLGLPAMAAVLAELRSTVGAVTGLDLRMQSNGVRLTGPMCALLVRYGVTVGISLDGDRPANDRHRRYAHGAGSHDEVRRALALLRRPEYRAAYGGLLCTVDPGNDPVAVYRALLAEAPPRIDFLLPHATWDSPPVRPAGTATPYADWLRRVYRCWTADGRPVPVRLFESLESTAAGGPSGTEALGVEPADLVVVETDGTWEQADSLKVAYHGAAATGLDVFGHSVDEVLAHPGIAVRQRGTAGLCATCRSCPVVRRCGGGLYAHRYRTGHGFANPSVYCADLVALISAVPPVPSAGPTAPARSRADGGLLASPVLHAMIEDLGTGTGAAPTIARLADTQLALNRAMLVALAGRGGGSGPGGVFAAGWELLTRLDVAAPEALRAVLAHPYLRPWLVACLRAPTPAGPGAGADPAYLACVAATAAVRAGVPAELDVPVRHGAVHLPGLGRLLIGPAGPDGTARIAVSADGFTVTRGALAATVATTGDAAGDAAGPPGWQPVRAVPAAGLRLALDDVDRYRDCHDWPVAQRLDAPAAARWAGLLDRAVALVRDEVPGQVPGFAGALRVVVPLAADPAGRRRSSAARHAFGAVSVAEPPAAADLAALLVHEVQHVKLGALMDLCPLVDPAWPGRVDVAWRPDPRPVGAALQGGYAHLALAALWRARRDHSRYHAVAAGHFLRYRDWTVEVLRVLPGTGGLTPAGELFVGCMRAIVESWRT